MVRKEAQEWMAKALHRLEVMLCSLGVGDAEARECVHTRWTSGQADR